MKTTSKYMLHGSYFVDLVIKTQWFKSNLKRILHIKVIAFIEVK